MAATLKLNCPYCDSSNASFTATHEWRGHLRTDERFVLMTCGHCIHGVICKVNHTRGSTVYKTIEMIGALDKQDLRVLMIWPRKLESLIPNDIPDNLASFYNQALKSMKSQSWDAAGVMFRKVIDVSTKVLMPEISGKSLFQRIVLLKENGRLTPDIADWASEVRLDGNEAAHEEVPFGELEALSLNQFAEAYLTYVYTLPAQVASRRLKRDGP